MGKILDYIAKETQGECFTSFKYCYDNITTPTIEYEDSEKHYLNLKDYAEDVHDPKPRDMKTRAEILKNGAPLFKYFLDGSRRVYKVDDIQYDKKVFPIVCGQISVACCCRDMNDDFTFKTFRHISDKSYPVICLPVTANGEGVDHSIFFNNLRNKINSIPYILDSGIQIEKVLYLKSATL